MRWIRGEGKANILAVFSRVIMAVAAVIFNVSATFKEVLIPRLRKFSEELIEGLTKGITEHIKAPAVGHT